MHNARHCPLLASCRQSRRPHPRLAGDLVLAPDWLLASTEVRAVSHTHPRTWIWVLELDRKDQDTTAQAMDSGRLEW